MTENEDLAATSDEMTSYLTLSIPVICSTASIAVFACGIGFIVSAVLKAVFLRMFGACEYKSLKRKRMRCQKVSSRELNYLLNQDSEEQSADGQYLIRRTRSGCAYGVYHLKKPELLPEVEEFANEY